MRLVSRMQSINILGNAWMLYYNFYHYRYGSVADYLVSAGFTLEEQQKLKDIFLETTD